MDNTQALVVEDNDLYRNILGLALTDSGFKVSYSTNGMDAMKILEGIPEVIFNLIIIDHTLPQMNGFELIEKILDKKIKFQRIIFLSELSNAEEKLEKFQTHPSISLLSKDMPIFELRRKYFKA